MCGRGKVGEAIMDSREIGNGLLRFARNDGMKASVKGMAVHRRTFDVEPDGGVALREVRKAPREEGVDVYGMPSWTTWWDWRVGYVW
jgi:hypothetical protein